MNPTYAEPGTEKIVDVHNIDTSKSVVKIGADAEDLTCGDDCVYCGLCVKQCPADALTVDRKEKIWEVDKEKCVKCGLCVDKCPKKCLALGELPAKEEKADAASDGKLTCDLEACVYCGLCVKQCPVDALEVDRKEKVWKVDDEACIKCGACVDKCPKKCLSIG